MFLFALPFSPLLIHSSFVLNTPRTLAFLFQQRAHARCQTIAESAWAREGDLLVGKHIEGSKWAQNQPKPGANTHNEEPGSRAGEGFISQPRRRRNQGRSSHDDEARTGTARAGGWLSRWMRTRSDFPPFRAVHEVPKLPIFYADSN